MATVAALAALGGGTFAVASIPDSGGKIHACYAKGSGALRLVDGHAKGSARNCHKGERKIAWSQSGADPNATLRVGQTLSGPWALAASGPAGSAQTQVQFTPQLPAVIPTGQTELRFASGPFTTECPGPGRAGLGWFCVYENASSNMSFGSATSVPPTDGAA